jgi:imidazole glycerol-phosphate synthase subunit HisH
MQLLFDSSEEGAGDGLGIIAGRVTRLHAQRVPQIGWNGVEAVPTDPLFATAPLPMAYFANSFVARPADPAAVIAWTEHEGDRFPSAVRAGRAVGVQFHPEKSSTDGVRFLHAFLDEAGSMKGSR